MKAKVFPDPVTASATTSLLDKINGIQVAWTGVGSENPCFVNIARVALLNGLFNFKLLKLDLAAMFSSYYIPSCSQHMEYRFPA